MALHIKIEDDNAAFEGDHRGWELATILRRLAERLAEGGELTAGLEAPLRDSNGNTVGEFTLSHRESDEDESQCLTPGCDEDASDGEGFDGYCGSCADKREPAED